MKELEKRYRKKNAIGALVCFLIGLVISLICFKDYLPIGELQNLDYAQPGEVREGRGEITVYDVYDYYSYWTDKYGKEVTRDYFVAMGDGEYAVYIGCELSGRKNNKAYEIMEALWNTEYEDIDYESIGYFRVKGKIKAIEGEDLKYYNDYLSDIAQAYDMSIEEVNEYFIPYVLVAAQVGDGDTYAYVFAILGIGLLGCSIGMLICALFGNPLKDIKNYCKKTSNEELTLARIERFYATTPERYGVVVNDEYFLYTGGSKPVFCDSKDVLWFYQYVVTRKTNFVTVGKDYYVKFRLANGKECQVATKQEQVSSLLNYFMGVLPDAIVGYSDALDRMYRSNRAQMIAEVERKHDARNGNACMHEDNESYQQANADNYNEPADFEYNEAFKQMMDDNNNSDDYSSRV